MTTIVAVTNKDLFRAAVIASRVENNFVTGLQVASSLRISEVKRRQEPLCGRTMAGEHLKQN